METEKPKSREWGVWLLVLVIAILVMAASYITLRRDFRPLNVFHRSQRHPKIVDKYADALGIALQFFDVQKCKKCIKS